MVKCPGSICPKLYQVRALLIFSTRPYRIMALISMQTLLTLKKMTPGLYPDVPQERSSPCGRNGVFLLHKDSSLLQPVLWHCFVWSLLWLTLLCFLPSNCLHFHSGSLSLDVMKRHFLEESCSWNPTSDSCSICSLVCDILKQFFKKLNQSKRLCLEGKNFSSAQWVNYFIHQGTLSCFHGFSSGAALDFWWSLIKTPHHKGHHY